MADGKAESRKNMAMMYEDKSVESTKKWRAANKHSRFACEKRLCFVGCIYRLRNALQSLACRSPKFAPNLTCKTVR